MHHLIALLIYAVAGRRSEPRRFGSIDTAPVLAARGRRRRMFGVLLLAVTCVIAGGIARADVLRPDGFALLVVLGGTAAWLWVSGSRQIARAAALDHAHRGVGPAPIE